MAEVCPDDYLSRKKLYDGVWAVVFALAGFAVLAYPNIVKLLHGLLDDLWVIGQDASFEVTLIAALHANTGTREVCAADIHLLTVKDKHLEVNPGHSTRTNRSYSTGCLSKSSLKFGPGSLA